MSYFVPFMKTEFGNESKTLFRIWFLTRWKLFVIASKSTANESEKFKMILFHRNKHIIHSFNQNTSLHFPTVHLNSVKKSVGWCWCSSYSEQIDSAFERTLTEVQLRSQWGSYSNTWFVRTFLNILLESHRLLLDSFDQFRINATPSIE